MHKDLVECVFASKNLFVRMRVLNILHFKLISYNISQICISICMPHMYVYIGIYAQSKELK